jgi:hypothetical protein
MNRLVALLGAAALLAATACLEDVEDPRPGPREPTGDSGVFDPGKRPTTTGGYGGYGSGSGSGVPAGSGAGSGAQGNPPPPPDAAVDAGVDDPPDSTAG